MKRYTTPDILFLDELGYLPCDARSGDLLYSIVSRRHERASTIITTNLAFKQWGSVFPGAACVGALVDRFTQHCHVLDIDGESWRQRPEPSPDAPPVSCPERKPTSRSEEEDRGPPMMRPSFEQLSAAPELATLAVLETAATMAILALGTEYPELATDNFDQREPGLRAAIELIRLARAIDLAIARYRRTLYGGSRLYRGAPITT